MLFCMALVSSVLLSSSPVMKKGVLFIPRLCNDTVKCSCRCLLLDLFMTFAVVGAQLLLKFCQSV